ncbi:MAG: DUF5103 domain-containing protein [Flavobacteriales bacterium]
MKKIIIVILFIEFTILAVGSNPLPKNIHENIDSTEEYVKKNFIQNDDFTYNKNIKSVQFYNTNNVMSYPILTLGDPNKLKLSFDDFGLELKYYNYTIIHCNANWEKSELRQNQYLYNNFSDDIKNYKYSLNTDNQFIHYSIELPNEFINPTLTGNYILKVYDGYDTDNVIITKRFMVVDNKVEIISKVKEATNVAERFSRQEVDFSIDHKNIDIQNPYEQVKVVLMQNYRWDNAITGLKPRYVNGTLLDYNYDDQNVFDGSNEFRNFDIKSLMFQSINVKHMQFEQKDRRVHIYLVDDESRAYKRYLSAPDLNGNFLIKRDESITDSDIEANYVKVHFSLKQYPQLKDGTVYIFGKLTDWKFKEEFKMKYDTLNNVYKQEVLLKQGYYNYMYCVVKDGAKNKGDLTTYEGSFFEAENDYTILVYYRNPTLFYDELIGIKTFNSVKRN